MNVMKIWNGISKQSLTWAYSIKTQYTALPINRGLYGQQKWLFIFIIFVKLSATTFSDENEKRFSIQASPLLLASDITYFFMDNDRKTYAFLVDAEFQYAINNYFNVSIAGAFYFERYLSGYLENSNGRYNEKYGQQFQYMIIPTFYTGRLEFG
jgi:hypothetical protein